MDKELIRTIADIIEVQEYAPFSDRGFNMQWYEHSCGTPSCIAGHIVHYALANLPDHPALIDFKKRNARAKQFTVCMNAIYFTTAKKIIDIYDDQAYLLFSLRHCPDSEDDIQLPVSAIDLEDITPHMAAAVLRELADTGKVNWEFHIKQAAAKHES